MLYMIKYGIKYTVCFIFIARLGTVEQRESSVTTRNEAVCSLVLSSAIEKKDNPVRHGMILKRKTNDDRHPRSSSP
jgi:hypothetical protein